MAQALTISGVSLSMGVSSLLVMVPTALSLALVVWFGRETRGRDLRDLDAGNANSSTRKYSLGSWGGWLGSFDPLWSSRQPGSCPKPVVVQ